MVRQLRIAAWVALLPMAACNGSGGPVASPSLLTKPASAYLLTLDELRVPSFTVDEPAHTVGYDSVSAGDPQLSTTLHAAALQDASTTRFFREVSELGTANGFIDVRSTVLRFPTTGAAHRAYLAETRHTDAVHGIVGESTDALGDEAHADQLTATSPDGVQLIEVTVIVRNANLVELLIVRGRLGGTSLADALTLAHRQLSGQ